MKDDKRHAALGIQGEPKLRIVLAWESFGPYHCARIAALRRLIRADARVFGLQIAATTSTYDWRTAGLGDDDLVLESRKNAERVGFFAVFIRTIAVLVRHQVNLLFVPSYWPATSLAMIFAARCTGTHVVLMCESHAGTSRAAGLAARIKRWIVGQCDSALVGGSSHLRYINGLGMPLDRIFMGYDAIDNRHFGELAAAVRANRGAFAVSKKLPARYILSIGRMVQKKNLVTLVKAFALVRSAGIDDVKLVFVGGGPMKGDLLRACIESGLSVADEHPACEHGGAEVLFFTFRQIEELPVFYALAECFVLPSTEEEWGLVVNEAMASGLPVVVSRVAGCAEDLVKHGENGYQFDPLSAEALAECIVSIARDRSRASQMGMLSAEIIENWGCDRFAASAKAAAIAAMR